MNYQTLIQDIKLEEMKKILSGLRVYSDMTKKLGRRGANLFHKQAEGTHDYAVEYFSTLSEDDAYKQAFSVYKKSFDREPKKEEIRFIPTDTLKWGMKVYLDDSMVDMSFKKVENVLQK